MAFAETAGTGPLSNALYLYDEQQPHRDGGEGNRTPDLLNAIQALSQLSYAPGRNAYARETLERARRRGR